ncbi:MAG: endopeptidase La [Alphaproteobacteria bacterium]|nr:endopeptidase La [Alphaproteobacteria bacterium]MCB9696358.1 endopeptidase La [Alphaproteobacteria bacterium]
MSDPVLLPTRGTVVFPGALRILACGRESSIRAVQRHLEEGAPLVLVPQLDPDEDDPLTARLSRCGVRGRVLRSTRLPDGSLRLLVEGHERIRTRGAARLTDGATTIPVDERPTSVRDPVRCRALAQEIAVRYQEYAQATGLQAQEHQVLAPGADDPEGLADQIFATTDLPLDEQIAALELPLLDHRLEKAIGHLIVQIARHTIHAEVNARVQRAMDDSQREYHLKEQLKAIRAELGEAWGSEADADRFLDRIEMADMPEEVAEEAVRETERLRRIHTDSAEYTLLRTWLETVCDLPWGISTPDPSSLGRAQKVLDRDHHGLEKAKERILEFLAVRRLEPESKGPILCFVGPPGVGKTSLGQSIAEALGRRYARIALGGTKDETEIRGHRRTYVGALPGRIVRGLVRAGSRNPVILLDELDKVGNDFRGDPASALLEVLDPEQNHSFTDHYLDLPFDLSQVLFVGTANVVDTIPAALLDRLELVEIPGYIEEDKIRIARRHLLPKLAKDHGLMQGNKRRIQVDPEALSRIVREYTREAGVRELERQLASLHRKIARKVVDGEAEDVRVKAADVPVLLGPPRYFRELAELDSDPGVVTGVAWTPTGGDLLFVEAIRMPSSSGKPSLKLTGSLGDVMKESAEAALSWLRANAATLGLAPEAFDAELHLHVPAGAIPKDGPSAGVTAVTAMASLLLQRPVREGLAMTGEITLRGKVLPVGGIKEKALAARRAGLKTFLLPTLNRNDLDDIPEELRKDLDFVFVDRVEEVLELALGVPLPAKLATRRQPAAKLDRAPTRPPTRRPRVR